MKKLFSALVLLLILIGAGVWQTLEIRYDFEYTSTWIPPAERWRMASEFMQQQGVSSQRRTRLSNVLDQQGDPLIILDQLSSLDDLQAERLLQWVMAGHRLILIPGYGDQPLTSRLGVQVLYQPVTLDQEEDDRPLIWQPAELRRLRQDPGADMDFVDYCVNDADSKRCQEIFCTVPRLLLQHTADGHRYLLDPYTQLAWNPEGASPRDSASDGGRHKAPASTPASSCDGDGPCKTMLPSSATTLRELARLGEIRLIDQAVLNDVAILEDVEQAPVSGLLHLQVGRGEVLVLNGVEPWTAHGIYLADHAELLQRWIAPHDRVLIFQAVNTPTLLSWLWQHLGALLVTTLLLLLLVLWRHLPRRLPLLHTPMAPLPGMADHYRASAELFERRGHAELLLAPLRQALLRRHGLNPERPDLLPALAAACGRGLAQMRHLMTDPPRDRAELIHMLATLDALRSS